MKWLLLRVVFPDRPTKEPCSFPCVSTSGHPTPLLAFSLSTYSASLTILAHFCLSRTQDGISTSWRLHRTAHSCPQELALVWGGEVGVRS
jgi:hypothetical protein